MRADPPSWWRDDEPAARTSHRTIPTQRCPYLEQILREPAVFGLLTRFKADCHVDHRTHNFTGRHPVPPCISEPSTCHFYRDKWVEEGHLIDRYRD
ncbi:MAG: hypothetical protein JF887_10800 [Candidatus Dormibacteraeota bacterium]|uniref:Uncharacterized protein n=1 Tax=Candidatus Amunia macphersoniae TaxID=3127014 RepID=A0A934KG34_9BACT|nr:hypothetical protein [Candidatus Dormibacteraeota bacterium]